MRERIIFSTYLRRWPLQFSFVSGHVLPELEFLGLLQHRPLVIWNLWKLVTLLLGRFSNFRLLRFHFLGLLRLLHEPIEFRINVLQFQSCSSFEVRAVSIKR